MEQTPIPLIHIVTETEILAGNLHYLREKYATGFITIEELEQGLESVLAGGPINVPLTSGSNPPASRVFA